MTVSIIVTGSECPPWAFVTTFDGVPSPHGGAPLPPLSVASQDAGWTNVKCASAGDGKKITIPSIKAAAHLTVLSYPPRLAVDYDIAAATLLMIVWPRH